MNPKLEETAEALDRNKKSIAELTTEECFRRKPELGTRWGEVGRKRCTEDSIFHLSYLIEAVRFDSPELFVDYIGWAKVLLKSLRIGESDLRDNLEVLREAVQKQLEGETAEIVSRVIRRAEEALPGLPSEIASFLKDDAPLASLAREWLTLLRSHQMRDGRELLIRKVREGTSVTDIYQYVLTPCLQEVGRLWQNRTINEAEEHYCAQATETMLSLLSVFFEGPRKRKAVVGFCVSNEQHEIGIRVLMDCFSVHGWDAVSFGSNVPKQNLEMMLHTWNPDIVAISATMTYHLTAVKEAIETIRRSNASKHPRVMVGGRPFSICPDLWKRVGADMSAQNCAEAMVCAEAK